MRLTRTLRNSFSSDHELLDVRIRLGLVAGHHARGRKDDVNSLHELDPLLLGVAAYAKCSSVIQTPQNLPGAEVEGDVEKLGDAHTRTHPRIARRPAYYCGNSPKY